MLCFSNAHTGGAIKYVEAIMAQGINFFRRGMVSDAMEKYSDASKLMLSIPDGALHPCLAEILCNQALGMLYSGMHLFVRSRQYLIPFDHQGSSWKRERWLRKAKLYSERHSGAVIMLAAQQCS